MSDPSEDIIKEPEQDAQIRSQQVPIRPNKTLALKAKLRSFLSLIGSKISLPSIANRFRTLLRTLSLSASTFRRSRKDERPKVLLQSSPWLALARCTVHLTPAFVSISLVAINLVGLFLGSELRGPQDQDDLKMGLLQIAAKVQVHTVTTQGTRRIMD